MKFPVRPRTMAQLQERATPQPVPGGQSEAVPWELFNVQLFTATTAQSRFFTAAPATPRFGNVGGAGLPAPQYFEIYYATFDAKIPPAVAGLPMLDLWQLLNGTAGAGLGDPTWTFVLADKQLGPFPLRGLHTRGGITGFTTNATSEYVNNSTTDTAGTFCWDGAIVIPPTQSFSVTLDWPGFVVLDAGEVELTVSLQGVLHRRVL